MAFNKHGAEAHFVRPDRVGYTSVLQAIPGFRPVQNAQQIAWEFTAAPFYATGPYQFAGLGNAQKLTLGDRIRMFFFKRKLVKQQKAVAAVAALTPAQGAGAPVTGKTDEQAAATKDAAALAITQGVVASGGDLMPQGVVQPQYVAGARLYWNNSVATPFAKASAIAPQVTPPFVGRVASQSAWRNFVHNRETVSMPFIAQQAWNRFYQSQGGAATPSPLEMTANNLRKHGG